VELWQIQTEGHSQAADLRLSPKPSSRTTEKDQGALQKQRRPKGRDPGFYSATKDIWGQPAMACRAAGGIEAMLFSWLWSLLRQELGNRSQCPEGQKNTSATYSQTAKANIFFKKMHLLPFYKHLKNVHSVLFLCIM
jgi:hypothetical protein